MLRILALTAMFLSPAAHSEWVRIGGNDSPAVYFQNATVKTSGVNRQAVFSFEYSDETSTPGGNYQYRSLKQFAEANCLRKEFRIWRTEAYAGPERTGRVVFINDIPAEFARPKEGTFAAMLEEALCR